ncbi:hypothetical protein HY312_00890 [Candidatus Saccharibacteria bacterium]|nr:hypothetical protein [Candidatus Saccharibacteria bacterium]
MRGVWSDSFIQWAEEQDEEASSYCEGHEHVISEHDGDLQSFDERTHSSDPIALTIGTGGWRSGTHEFFRYVRYSVSSSDSITAWDKKGDRTYILFHGSMFFGTLSTR